MGATGRKNSNMVFRLRKRVDDRALSWTKERRKKKLPRERSPAEKEKKERDRTSLLCRAQEKTVPKTSAWGGGGRKGGDNSVRE